MLHIKIKFKTTLDAVLAFNKLGENNQVLIRWIPAHSGYLGNEKADSLAERRSNNTDATLLNLPISKVTWDVAIRERTKHNIWTKWRDAPPSHFTRVWRKKFSKSIHNLNRGNLRKVVGSEECSLRLIRSAHFSTGRRLFNFATMKYINATWRLNPINEWQD